MPGAELTLHTNGVPGQAEAYLICATPRTGSSLLCGLLESTGVAGHPESYFRAPDEPSWAARWGISTPGGTFRFADYLAAAVAAGRTGNGVFAARIMWGTMGEVTDRLAQLHPGLTGTDGELLDQAFGATRYVYLRRGNVLAQAVSWLRAEQANVWFETTQARPEPGQEPGREPWPEPRFDSGRIHDLIQMIEEHNAAWQEWFRPAGTQPYLVQYEDLDADPAGTTRGILGFLGLDLPPNREIRVQHRRLADDLNAEWIRRYQAGARERRGG